MKTTITYTHHTQVVASLLVFIGSVCFAAKAVIVKLAYRYDIDPTSLLALRMLFSLPFFLIIAWNARRKAKMTSAPSLSRKDWAKIIMLGLFGYYFASLFDFLGLQYITAGLERLILFTYPTLVVIISFFFLGKRITSIQFAALLLTYLGISVAFADHLFHDASKHFLLGAGLIFVSALVYAIYLIGGSDMIPRLGTQRFTSLALIAASVAILVHHGLIYQWRLFHYPLPVYGLSLLMAIISTVLPSFMVAEGLRVIGPSNTSIISSFSPVAIIILGKIFLNENFGWLQWLGTAFVIGGVLIITLKKKIASA